MWISALANYYQEDKTASVEKKKTYLKALEALQKAYPEDLEAKVFLCLQKWQFESEVPIKDRAEVDKMYGEVLAKNPLHPLHHYRIHLWNYNGDAKALNSAALSGTSSPGIAHMWHMQGHTYSALERYHDAAWSQEASARVDHAQMIRNHVMPDQIHNFAHNNQWLVEDLCYTGRATAALDLAKNMIELPRHPSYNTISGGHNGSASEGRKRLFQTLWDYELWDETIALSAANYLEPTDSAEQQLKRIHALGIAYFRKGDVVNSSEQMKLLEEMQKRGKYATSEGEKSLAESHRTSISQILTEFKCETALREGKKPEALKLIDAMKDWLPKERASQLRFRAGDSAKAEELATASVKEKSGQIVPVANLVEVLYETGKKKEAREKFKTLQALSGWIENEDMNRVPLYRRLSAISAELGMRADWRIPANSAKDIGPRPPLERLGPFRWHPSAAPDWTLVENSGKKLRLRDYAANGKPVIVVFYLGSGCQACMEQLNAFAPMTKQFDAAGISIVAIGVDPRKELKLTQDKSLSGGAFPFPVVSDKEMRVFKAYGAYDDFEKMPLHCIFYIFLFFFDSLNAMLNNN